MELKENFEDFVVEECTTLAHKRGTKNKSLFDQIDIFNEVFRVCSENFLKKVDY
jgi:hypothetical protein